MKRFFKNKYIYLCLSLMIAICGGILFYYVLFYSTDLSFGFRRLVRILLPVIDGFCIAYLLSPAMDYIEKRLIIPVAQKLKIKIDGPKTKRRIRSISIVITLLIFFLTVYIFILMVMPQIIESIKNLIFSFPVYADNLQKWIMDLLKDNPDIEAIAYEYIETYTSDVQKFLTGDVLPWANHIIKEFSARILNAVVLTWNFIIGLIISVYMLGSKEHFAAQGKKIIFALFEEKTGNKILDEFRFTHKTFGGFITGKILDSIIMGLLCFIGCEFLNMPYAVLISFIIGLTNIIPFFGPVLGAIPSALLILMVDPMKCLYFIIFVLVLQQVDGNIIGPKILGDSTGLSGFWVIFAITIFGGLFGVVGMFVGVPIFAICYSFFKRMINTMLRRKQLPESTLAYMQAKHVKHGQLILADDPSAVVEEEPKPVKIILQVDNVDADDSSDENSSDK